MTNWCTMILLMAALTSATCNRGAQNKTCFKARLEVKGICMNYTFSLLEGDTAVVKVAPAWTDENTGVSYKNAFALANPCGFKDLQEGAEFYFVMEPEPVKDCAVCEAYYPTPPQKNNIRVVEACP